MAASNALPYWSNELVLEFLKLYQSEPCIYDPKHPARKNKMKVNAAWNKIKNALSTQTPLSQIKRKKDSLMASFRHHRRKKKDSMQPDSGSNGVVYKPTWFAYDVMEGFLGASYDGGDSTYDVEYSILSDGEHENNAIVEDMNSINYVDPPIPTPASQHPRFTTQHHNKRPYELQHETPQMDQSFVIFPDKVKTEDDECDLYGKLVAKKLRRIPESDREKLMYEIDGLFLKAKKDY